MVILEKKYTVKELCKINSFINGFVKGVVDLDQELVALDADMHFSDFIEKNMLTRSDAYNIISQCGYV